MRLVRIKEAISNLFIIRSFVKNKDPEASKKQNTQTLLILFDSLTLILDQRNQKLE